MTDSPLLALPYLEQNQSQKHVTVNEALAILDAAVHLSVANRSTTTPPVSPAEGDRYLIAATATGDWTGSEGSVGVYQDGVWNILTPRNGWVCYVEDEEIFVKYDGGWVGIESAKEQTTHGAFSAVRAEEELLSGMSGATKVSTIQFPAGCIALGVSLRVTTTITGAASFDVGDGVAAGLFATAVGLSAGTTDVGSIAPTLIASATGVTLTANGSNFTAGAVRITLHYLELSAPTS